MNDTCAHVSIDIKDDWIEEFLLEQSDDDADLFDDATSPEFAHDTRGDWT